MKNLLNITPETFIQEFPRLVDTQFTHALKELATLQQTQITLNPKTHPLPCQLGLIPTGLFKNHILGIVSL